MLGIWRDGYEIVINIYSKNSFSDKNRCKHAILNVLICLVLTQISVKMNRIVIVGNGFDIAHNLKTKYEDFLYDYFIKAIIEFEKKWNYEDDFIKLISRNYPNYSLGYKISDKLDNLNQILQCDEILWNVTSNEVSILDNQVFFEIRYKSDFFKEIVAFNKWSDIEKHYFEFLIRYPKDDKYVKKLNFHFEVIKSNFIKYIESINNTILNISLDKLIYSSIIEDLSDNITRDLFNKKFRNKIEILSTDDQLLCNDILFLNFNYTSLLNRYLQIYSRESKHHQIHGDILNQTSIIFGYGDDTHPKYADLENEDIEDLLKHIKSFYYPNNSLYNELIDFIESGYFEVVVIGHSLGLSDRVLLKTIFDNQNCRNIRLFHRGNNESHFKKRIALSRHFTDKISMRRKIEEYNRNDVFGN